MDPTNLRFNPALPSIQSHNQSTELLVEVRSVVSATNITSRIPVLYTQLTIAKMSESDQEKENMYDMTV